MATEQFDERLNQVERALKVISTIENNPELQTAAFAHLFGESAPVAKLPSGACRRKA
ncbi:MAG: hypothetical protein JWN09_1535 [Microbacteriaceae bacterium]|nr:hypothetical protein [Microbacteriaceae bacterium]